MFLSEKTVDDLLHALFEQLLISTNRITASRGSMTEVTGILLELTNPRARLSRTETKGRLFSCLGELFWYLAKTDNLEFIAYYLSHYAKESEDNVRVYGAYGPRLFSMDGTDQIANVIALLRKKPSSRRAVIQLFDAADIATHHKGIPCTCTLQFMIRDNRLFMLTNMRSNDVYRGLPFDTFAFTMLQEIVARTLGVELGTYKHAVGSMHLYEDDRAKAEEYLEEGWQETIAMPPMPPGDPWPALKILLEAEADIRKGVPPNLAESGDDQYWTDLARLLQVFRYQNEGRAEESAKMKETISCRVYDTYIDSRSRRRA